MVGSRDGGRDPESQLLWKLPGSPVISEALLHTDTFEHGHLDSLLSWREARLQWFHPRLLPRRKKEGLYAKCLPRYMGGDFSSGAIIKKKNTGCLLPSSPSFRTKGNQCFFHYYFLSTMTINTLQRITHQWKAIQRILH